MATISKWRRYEASIWASFSISKRNEPAYSITCKDRSAASGIGSLESIPGLLNRLQIRAQATLTSGIGSLESIFGLLKRLQIRAQATLASGIGSLESIPGLLKRLQKRAQATLASGICFLELIPRLHNMKNNDEDDFFYRNKYIRPSTIKGTKNNEFIRS